MGRNVARADPGRRRRAGPRREEADMGRAVEGFLTAFTAWAAARPDIQAVALVGSHARNAATDRSDVDLVIIADQPEAYLRERRWIEEFGPVLRHQTEDYGLLTSLRAWYANGIEVEFGWTDERWAAVPLDPGTRQVIAGGLRILFERRPLLSRHQDRRT